MDDTNRCVYPECPAPFTWQSKTHPSVVYCEEHKMFSYELRNGKKIDTPELFTRQDDAIGSYITCKYKGCDRQSTHRPLTRETPMFCNYHAGVDMYKIGRYPCTVSGCILIAVSGINGSIRCNKHRKSGDRFIVKDLCNIRECHQRNAFNFIGYPPMYCKHHKTEYMISHPIRLCEQCDSDAKLINDGKFLCYMHALHTDASRMRASHVCVLPTVNEVEIGPQEIQEFHITMDAFVREKIEALFADD